MHPIGCTFFLADLNNGDENGAGVNDCLWQSEPPLIEGAELSQGRKRQCATESESPSLRQRKENFCLPKVLFLFIQAAGLAYHHDAVVDIIKVGKPTLYLITRQRAFPCGLMIYRNKLRMICNSYGIDDIQGFALICSRQSGFYIKTPNITQRSQRNRLLA